MNLVKQIFITIAFVMLSAQGVDAQSSEKWTLIDSSEFHPDGKRKGEFGQCEVNVLINQSQSKLLMATFENRFSRNDTINDLLKSPKRYENVGFVVDLNELFGEGNVHNISAQLHLEVEDPHLVVKSSQNNGSGLPIVEAREVTLSGLKIFKQSSIYSCLD